MQPCFASPSTFLRSHRLSNSVVCVRAPLSRRWRVRPVCAAAGPPPPADEDEAESGSGSEEHDIPQSAVDWNNEWSKFQEGGMRSMAPQGREAVSKQEVAAARAKARINAVTSKVPSRQQLFKDWRFWLAIIATLSLFSAFVQSSQTVGGSPI